MDGASEDAFRILYRRHTPRVYQLVLRFLGGTEMDAEDVIQETWVQATKRLGQFRWESKFGTWLTAIALNQAREVLRRRRRRQEPVLVDSLELPVAPASHAERMDLETAIAALPDGYRSVLVLHDIEGFKHHEIADLMGISPGTSKSQLSGARRTLRRWLGRTKENESHVVYRS